MILITIVTTFVTNRYYTCDLYYICDQLLHLCLQPCHDSSYITKNGIGGNDLSKERRQFSGRNKKVMFGDKIVYIGVDIGYSSICYVDGTWKRIPNYPQPFNGLTKVAIRISKFGRRFSEKSGVA